VSEHASPRSGRLGSTPQDAGNPLPKRGQLAALGPDRGDPVQKPLLEGRVRPASWAFRQMAPNIFRLGFRQLLIQILPQPPH
jgi:hypothetical protein